MKKKLTALLLTTLVIVCCVVSIPLGAFAHTEPANGQIASFPQETLGASTQSSSYQLQYNTWDGVWDDNYLNYNCYSYALGISDNRYNPGQFSNQNCNKFLIGIKSIDIIQQYVKDDLSNRGYNCIQVQKNTYTLPPTGATLICVRNGHAVGSNVETDYHFMKYQDGNWYHKPGTSAILKYDSIPDINVPWISEGVGRDGIAAMGNITYDGDIYFISYRQNHSGVRYYSQSYHKIDCDNCEYTKLEAHNMKEIKKMRMCTVCGFAIKDNGEIVEPWQNEDLV